MGGPTRGEHVIVYQTTDSDPRLVPALRAVPEVAFRVYGMRQTARSGVKNNVELCSFDERAFLADLASARAVIANGGFSALAEAIALGKPVLSVPLQHQAEQQLNAAWLEALGLGMSARRITPDGVRAFISRCGIAETHPANASRSNIEVVDRVLAEVA